MPALLRPALAALGIACLLSAASLASSSTAFAQAKQPPAPSQAAPAPAQQQAPPLKQIALTDKQIDGVLAAQKDMDAITAKLPENTAPDQKVIAQLDEAAKKHGFAGYDDYNNVVDNISLVIGGFDPATKKYVGTEAVIKAQIAQVQADKKMPAKDKKEALDELNEALKTPAPQVENKGNIDVVAKYYDKLVAALGDDEN
jgi:Skp family chaperone for outer membrane proteins